MNSREGESQENQYYRSNRIIQINGNWFFLTREGGQEGPFANRDETAEALRLFVAVMSSNLLPSQQTGAADGDTETIESAVTKDDIARLRELLEKSSSTESLEKLNQMQNEKISVTSIEFTQVAKESGVVKKRSSRSANDAYSFCSL